MRDLEILDIILDSINKSTGASNASLKRYQEYPYPQRLPTLSGHLKMSILRQQGDYKQYLALQQKIFDLAPEQATAEDKAIYDIITWLDGGIDTMVPVESGLVISLLAYGETYINKLLKYTLKSMMARENLPFLAVEKQVVFYIQTDAYGKELIANSPIVKEIKALGVQFHYVIIPDMLIKQLGGQTLSYWMLGASASLGLQYARVSGAAFHHSYPDLVYSNKFFLECLRLSKQHRAILGSGLRCDETLVQLPASLSISSADLIALHLNALHAASWRAMVNNRASYWQYPYNHIHVWESEEVIHFNSPHLMAHWLEHSLIKDLEPRYFMTLDSELDLLCTDFYVVGEQDEIYQLEMSSPDRQELDDSYTDARTSALHIWNCIGHRDMLKFFVREMRVRVNRNIRPLPENYIPEAHVKVQQKFLYNMLMATDRYAGAALAVPRQYDGCVFQ